MLFRRPVRLFFCVLALSALAFSLAAPELPRGCPLQCGAHSVVCEACVHDGAQVTRADAGEMPANVPRLSGAPLLSDPIRLDDGYAAGVFRPPARLS